MTPTLAFFTVCAVSVQQPAPLPRLAVLPVEVDESARDEVPSIIDDYLLTAVQQLGTHEVVGPDDISAMLGFERQKELVGCDDASCFADLGGALGVDTLAVFKVARLETDWVVTAKLIDLSRTTVVRRANHFISGSDARSLLNDLPTVARKLFGLPVSSAARPASTSATASAAPVSSSSTSATSSAPSTSATSSSSSTSATSSEASTSSYLDRLSAKHRGAYERYASRTARPLSPEGWVARQNRESTGLFVAELLSLGGILGIPFIGVALNDPVTPFLWVMCLVALPTLLIIDVIDIGEVPVAPPPRRSTALGVPPDRARGEGQPPVGLTLTFAW